MRATRPALVRMNEVVRRIAQGKFPNCRTLATEIEVTAKTIHRDIECLRDSFGHDIRYHPQRYGFYYAARPQPIVVIPDRIDVLEEPDAPNPFLALDHKTPPHGSSYRHP